ncbi:ABC transporter ATP-binding protein [Nocardia sp. NPDC059239]|uniref:ABC transporter ATP-binding protein n=1 Tax=Nocardia sp. NPDC059239 TaxID=3346785 RepID=UPI003693F9DC
MIATTAVAPGRTPADTDRQSAGLECAGVSVRYGATTALDNISLACPAGKVLVLLGPSGCGKTTLLRCIAGLATPTSGQVRLDGRDITGVSTEQRDIAMVFQHYALYPEKTAQANIEFPLRMRRVPKAQRRERVREVSRLLKLDSLLHRKPAQLSGGQQQRVGIGRALVRNPSLLLMDEPLSNLDAQLRSEMRAELRALQRELQMTTIYVTHDQAEALSMADELAVLRDGKLEQIGQPADVFNRPASQFVGSLLGGMSFVSAARLGRAAHTEATTVGVRGEDFRLGEGRPGDLTLTGDTRLTELVGRDRLVHLDVGGRVVRARLHADHPIGERVTIHASHSDVHQFNADGQRCPTAPATSERTRS